MPNRSNNKNYAAVNMVDPANRIINNTTVAGGAIDLQGYDVADIVLQIGVWADTVAGGLMEFGLQHNDDTVSGGFVDVPNSLLTDTVEAESTVSGAIATGVFAKVSSTENDQTTAKTSYIGNKRYIRLKINGEKNLANGTPSAALALLGKPAHAPID